VGQELRHVRSEADENEENGVYKAGRFFVHFKKRGAQGLPGVDSAVWSQYRVSQGFTPISL
jgi:hypothetical protein